MIRAYGAEHDGEGPKKAFLKDLSTCHKERPTLYSVISREDEKPNRRSRVISPVVGRVELLKSTRSRVLHVSRVGHWGTADSLALNVDRWVTRQVLLATTAGIHVSNSKHERTSVQVYVTAYANATQEVGIQVSSLHIYFK